MSTGTAHSFAIGLISSLAVVGVGAVLLHQVRRRTLALSIALLTLVPLVAIIVGVVGTSGFMFTDELRRTALVWLAVTLVSVPSAMLLGRSIARQSVWEREALERERNAERSRRELLAWLSHDLRTPIAGIQAMTEALDDGVVSSPDDVRTYARLIRTESMRLSGMIDDLFEMSQINAGTMRLELGPVAIDDVVGAAADGVRPTADRRGVRVEVLGHPAGTLALGAAPELMRVLRNLLVNAIRHSPEGGAVTVSVGVEGTEVWMRVGDACGGIPEADLTRIFDMGFRGTDARESDGEGAGMGLAITRGLLDAQSGSVVARNRASGCEFEVRLPTP